MVLKDILRISKNSIGFSTGIILTNAIGFILLPIYTLYLTPEDYGIISIAAVVSAIFSIICIFGMRGAISRSYYDYNNDPLELREYISTICITVLSVSFCLTILLYLFGEPLFDKILPDLPFYPYIALVLWTTFLSIPLNFSFILLQARERSFLYSIIHVSRFLLTTILIILFVVVYMEGPLGSLKGQFFAGIIFFFVGIALLWKDIGLLFNVSKLKDSLSFGIPLVPHELASWISSTIDRFFLSHYTTLSTVGLYSLGYQFAAILGFITVAINFAWVPYFFSTAKELGEQARPTFALLTSYYMMFILFIALCIIFFAENVIYIMTTPVYYESTEVVPIIVLSFIFGGMYYMVVNQLFFLKRTAYVMYSTIIAAISNICLNIILIPRFEMIGAGLATAISCGFCFIFVYYFSNKLFPIRYEYGRIFKICLLATLIYVFSLFIPDWGMIVKFLIKSLLIGAYLIGLVICGFVTQEEIRAGRQKLLEFIHLRRESRDLGDII
jgi:O-antigen/teichoic acid export membrane protein